MMFRLDIPSEPYWLDLPQGVRVKVRPLDAMVEAAARNSARSALSAARAEIAERLAVGAPVSDLPDLADENLEVAFLKIEMARGLARYGMMEWEGVGDEDGTAPLPFNAERAARLASHPAIMDAFLLAYFAPVSAMAAEGNASPLTPNGSTAAGGTTADAVEPIAPTAPAPPRLH
jgi:hypothetical protein